MVQRGGLAKVQNVPFSYWKDLKRLNTGGELLEFARQHSDLESALRVQLRGSALRVMDRGDIKSASEVTFIDGILKSSILRAGGSAKTSWAPWSASGDCISSNVMNRSGSITFEEGPMLFSVPATYSLKIDEVSFQRLRAATELISTHLDPDGSKYCIRADFVLERSNGLYEWWLVDVGESNLGFVLGSQMHGLAGTGLDFAGMYANMAKGFVDSRNSVMIVYQDDRMLQGMPFEFEGIKERLNGAGIHAELLTKDDFLNRVQSGAYNASAPPVLRFFRAASQVEVERLNKAEVDGLRMIDPPRFIPLMQKQAVTETVDIDLRADLERLVCVPKMLRVEIGNGTEMAFSTVLDWMHINGVSDAVLKPGTKGKSATTAFFYSIDNPRHRLEMKKTIGKIAASDIRTVVVEELVGDGAIEDRKTEVRVWALRAGD